MHVSAWNVALQTINFLVLAWLLQRFLWKPVARIIEARQEEVEARLGQATAERERAREAEAACEARREALAAEVEKAMDGARRREEEEARAIRAEAERKAAELSERARAEIEAERAKALAELRGRALDLAAAIAEKLLREVAGGAGQSAFARTIEGLRDPEQQRIVARQLADGRVEVVSAGPPEGDEERALRARLAELAGRPIEAMFRVDPALLAGLELRFPHGVWQASARASLTRIVRALEERDGSR